MRGISVRSLLISHLAMFMLFCLSDMIGYMISLTVLHIFSGTELSELHQRLKLDESFGDILAALALSLSAGAAGWIAAGRSSEKPLIHGALSGVAFFLLFFYWIVSDFVQFPQLEIDLLTNRPLYQLPQLTLPLFGIIGASMLVHSRRRPRRRQSTNEITVSIREDFLGDLAPLAWKWLVRLIWLTNIVIFQMIELQRYWRGETYRPVVGLFAAAMYALVVWYAATKFRNILQRRKALRHNAQT